VSRRNQSRRRRAYGRRQHEVRERRFTYEAAELTGEVEQRIDWLPGDNADEPHGYGSTFEGYLR